MGMRREELSTADLAGQPPTSAEPSDVTEEEADLARDDRTDAADRTDDDAARDDLAAEDRAPEDLARDDLGGEPGLDRRPLTKPGHRRRTRRSAAAAAAGRRAP
jgi:hypothetical protein